MAGNFQQYFKNFTYGYLLPVRKAFKISQRVDLKQKMESCKVTKNHLFARGGKKNKEKMSKIFPRHKDGWRAIELNFLPLTITQTFTTFDSIF